jgi:hypothetical protein
MGFGTPKTSHQALIGSEEDNAEPGIHRSHHLLNSTSLGVQTPASKLSSDPDYFL